MREIKENIKASTWSNWIDGDTLCQDRGTRGKAGLRQKKMGLGLGLSLNCASHPDGDDFFFFFFLR